MMSESSHNPHMLTAASCNVYEPVESATSDGGHDHIDVPVTTWEAHWIDIGGEG